MSPYNFGTTKDISLKFRTVEAKMSLEFMLLAILRERARLDIFVLCNARFPLSPNRAKMSLNSSGVYTPSNSKGLVKKIVPL